MLDKLRTLIRSPIIKHKQTAIKQTVTLDGNSLDLEKLSLLGSGNANI